MKTTLHPLKLARAVRAVVRITMDPTRLDEVFVLADTAEESPQLAVILERFRSHPVFSAAFVERPRLGRVDLDALGRLPPGTFGRAYADFMRAHDLSPEDLVLVEGQTDLDFLRNHLRETHDLWHVVTGFETDVAGELGLQAFYLAQIHGPFPVMLLAVGMLNALLRELDDAPRRVEAIARGWLLGKRAAPLFGQRWAARWEEPLEDLRRELRIDLAGVEAALAEHGTERALARAA
jgi:ubiquinone biosynthesis protein Coq4